MKHLAPLLLVLTAAAPGPSNTAVPPVFLPAPMPDVDLAAPRPPLGDPHATEVAPKLYQPSQQFQGDGYSYGSTVQSLQERSLKPAPGVSFKVPLY